jgi:hypothetical protein
MAVRHTCTINLRCWKRHTCVACGGQFSYLFLRKAVGTASTPEAATKAAQANAKKRLAGDVDSHPCPTCGIYQPDMIASNRGKWQGWLLGLSIVAVIVLFILSASHALQDDVLAPSAAVTIAAIGLLQFFVDAQRPNRDPAANRQTALKSLQRGVLRHDKPGQTQVGVDAVWRPSGSRFGPVAFVCCVAALLGLLSPSIVRDSQGWPFNQNCYPPVVGPGDSTCFYMSQRLQSVKGYYRGTVTATAREAGGGPEFTLRAQTSQADWGQTINDVKAGEESSSARPWVTLDVPGKAELAGKQIECRVQLNAAYPVANPGGKTFHTEQGTFSDNLSLQLGPPRSGSTYRTIWWCAALGGMSLFLVAGALRLGDAWRLRKQALPTSVYNDPPPEQPA